MATPAVAEAEGPVLRPVGALISLIKKDLVALKEAEAAAAEVVNSIYIAIGEKLLEAKAQIPHREFAAWVKDNFKFGQRASQQYMQLARATNSLSEQKRNAIRAADDMSLREMIREHTDNKNYGRPATWQAEIRDNVRKAREDAARLADEHLTRQQERDAEKKLALRLIDIGFKVLVKELHPDKGGSKDAMARLSRVRARLKEHA